MRSKQVCERGLRGGETDGNTSGRTGVLMATRGATEGIAAIPACAAKSGAWSKFRVSVIEPWKFRRELTQQSGSEDELGSVVLALAGQHACDCEWLGRQSALSPESCTRKTASKI